MSGSNGRIHFNTLRPSDPDAVALAQALEERFVELCGTYLRVTGVRLVPPPSLDNDMMRWRQMRVRHRKGDFRNSEVELHSVKCLCQWTLDINASIRNQPTYKVAWKE